MLDPTDSEHKLLIDDDQDGISNRVLEPEENRCTASQPDQANTQESGQENNRLTNTVIGLAGILLFGLLAIGIIIGIINKRRRT